MESALNVFLNLVAYPLSGRLMVPDTIGMGIPYRIHNYYSQPTVLCWFFAHQSVLYVRRKFTSLSGK